MSSNGENKSASVEFLFWLVALVTLRLLLFVVFSFVKPEYPHESMVKLLFMAIKGTFFNAIVITLLNRKLLPRILERNSS